MKRHVIIISGIMFALLFLALATGIIYKANTEDSVEAVKLPSFTLLTIDHKSFNTSEIKAGPLLVVHFNPECDHCKYEINGIVESGMPSMGLRILLITQAAKDSVSKFCMDYSISDYSSISVLLDSSDLFGKNFKSRAIPSNYLYDKDLKLIKVLEGEYKTETIIKYLSGIE
jgi:hypothetical protein